MFIIRKKSILWICKTSTDTNTHTAQNLTAFHQADDAFDNYVFLIAFIESIDQSFSKPKRVHQFQLHLKIILFS